LGGHANDQPLHGIEIEMYFNDHGFPHFHAKHADGTAKIRIDTLEIIESDLARRQLHFVLAWPSYIRTNWKRTGVGRAPVTNCFRSSH
jgi:hypothetical protein